jgi:hypothetical protein
MLKPGKVVEHPAAIVVTVFPKPLPYLSLDCIWKLLLESGAGLADVAVTFSGWLADKFRLTRRLGDDGIGTATTFIKSYVEQLVSENRELSAPRVYFIYQICDQHAAKEQYKYHALVLGLRQDNSEKGDKDDVSPK